MTILDPVLAVFILLYQRQSTQRDWKHIIYVYKNVNVSFKMDLLIIHFVENQSMTNAHKFLLSTLLF